MHYGAFLQKYLTAAKVSSSVLIAILNMHFFVRTKLLEWNVTGLAYSDKLVTDTFKFVLFAFGNNMFPHLLLNFLFIKYRKNPTTVPK